MFDCDKLCRSVLYPRCAKQGVFDEAALLQFSDVNRDGSLYALSLGSRFILQTDDGAHAYGRRTAQHANQGIRDRTGEDPSPDVRVHYLGFYDLVFGPLSKVTLENYESRLIWFLEHGEHAHFQLEWIKASNHPPGNKTDKLLRRDRSAARTMIASLLSGPFEDERSDTEVHVSNFELPKLPSQIVASA